MPALARLAGFQISPLHRKAEPCAVALKCVVGHNDLHVDPAAIWQFLLRKPRVLPSEHLLRRAGCSWAARTEEPNHIDPRAKLVPIGRTVLVAWFRLTSMSFFLVEEARSARCHEFSNK